MKLKGLKQAIVETYHDIERINNVSHKDATEKSRHIIIARTTKIPRKETDCRFFRTNENGKNKEYFVYVTDVQKVGKGIYLVSDGPRKTFVVKVVRM